MTSTDASRQDRSNQPHAQQHSFESLLANSAPEFPYERQDRKNSNQNSVDHDSARRSVLPVLPILENGAPSQPSMRSVSAAAAGAKTEHEEFAGALESFRQLTLARPQAHHHHHLVRPWLEKSSSSQGLRKARLDLSVLSADRQAQPLVHPGHAEGGHRKRQNEREGASEAAAESQLQGGPAPTAYVERGSSAWTRESSSGSNLLTVLHF